MRTKKVTRHYCDHCGKGMFKKPSMELHERGCIRNLQRVCFMCGNSQPGIVETATALVEKGESAESLTWLRAECDTCPACMLSVIQYAGRVLGEWMFYECSLTCFDYKKEAADYNAERFREESDLLH